MKLKWYGTATLILESGDKKILFDPFFTYTTKTEEYRKKYLGSFKSCDAIVVTHGHFDHIHAIPEVVKDNPIPIFCTKTPAATLVRKGVDKTLIHIISPNDSFSIGDTSFKVYKAKHASFGMSLVLKTISRKIFWKKIKLAAKIGHSAIFDEKEGGEIVLFEVKRGEKSLVVMGSLGLDKNTQYPKDIDMLVLPYQGRSDLPKYSMKTIELMKAKKVLADHFESYAPPISMDIPTDDLLKIAKQKDYKGEIFIAKRDEEYTV